MFKSIGIVLPQLHSDALAAPVRRLGGKSLLEWVVRRVTDCLRLDQVIVAVGEGPEEQFLAELVPRDVPLFVGSSRDVLGRVVDAADVHEAQSVVLVSVSTLFVDPVLIDRLVNTADEHPTCDYISYAAGDGRPAIQSSVGLFAEWCRADALRLAAAEAIDAADRVHPSRYLFSHPEEFNIRLLAPPPGLDRDDVRLRIDSEEDWEHAQTIFEALGPESLDWQRIAGLLEQQPALRNRMATLNRRLASPA